MRPYQQCVNCLLDTNDDPYIQFDEHGVCNHCRRCQNILQSLPKDEEAEKILNENVERIKREGKGKKYDVIVGVSGGTDSTYLAYLTKKLGLRALCVHFDNGWNSELAVKNIEQVVNKLGFDLYTYVVNWEEFRDIQRSFFKADVIDIELITDHAIIATLYQTAAKFGIKNIFIGTNHATENVLPEYWIHNKTDGINILDIHKKYGEIKKLKTYPYLTPWRKFKYKNLLKIKEFAPLNYVRYNKKEVIKILEEELGWRNYGGKHYESVFTRFYQGYILPKKFGVDKRKAHLSNLICSGQITKEEALEELKKPIYPPELEQQDYEFVIKKLGFTKEEFEEYLKRPRREHTEFKTERPIYEMYPILKPLKPAGDLLKKIFKNPNV